MRIELKDDTAIKLQAMGLKCNRSVNELANMLLEAIVDADINLEIKIKMKETLDVKPENQRPFIVRLTTQHKF